MAAIEYKFGSVEDAMAEVVNAVRRETEQLDKLQKDYRAALNDLAEEAGRAVARLDENGSDGIAWWESKAEEAVRLRNLIDARRTAIGNYRWIVGALPDA